MIERRYPLAGAQEAHRRSESRRARGKLVLTVNERLADATPVPDVRLTAGDR